MTNKFGPHWYWFYKHTGPQRYEIYDAQDCLVCTVSSDETADLIVRSVCDAIPRSK